MEVFLSYSSANKQLAEELNRSLHESGVTTWFAEERLRPGDNAGKEIGRALRHAHGIVFLIEPGWKEKPGLQNEWSIALEAAWKDPKKRLVPVLIQNAEAPAFLRDRAPIRLGKRHTSLAPVVRGIVNTLRSAKPPVSQFRLAREKARWRNRLREIEGDLAALRQ